MDLGQRRLAERRLLAALRRLHRREPMRVDIRIDAVLGELRADPGERLPSAHRGGGSLSALSDAELLGVLDGLVSAGTLVRRGHRLGLAGHQPVIPDPDMRARVERLLADLREAGAAPPPVEAAAARLGIPAGMVEQLRRAGELVHYAEGIDYPDSVAKDLRARLQELARHGPLTVPRVRDALGTTRRHAEALLARRGHQRDTRGVR